MAVLGVDLRMVEHAELLAWISLCAASRGLFWDFCGLAAAWEESIVWSGLLSGIAPFVFISSVGALGVSPFNLDVFDHFVASAVLLMLFPPVAKMRMGVILLLGFFTVAERSGIRLQAITSQKEHSGTDVVFVTYQKISSAEQNFLQSKAQVHFSNVFAKCIF